LATKTNKKLPAIHSTTGEKFIPVGQCYDSMSMRHSKGIVCMHLLSSQTLIKSTTKSGACSWNESSIPGPIVSCQRVTSFRLQNPANCWHETYFCYPDFKESTTQLALFDTACHDTDMWLSVSQELCKEDYIIYDNETVAAVVKRTAVTLCYTNFVVWHHFYWDTV